MTVSSITRKAGPFDGNGATTKFPFAFKVFTTADVLVVLTDPNGVESDQTIVTDYTLSLNADQDANPGGTITMGTAPATGYKLTATSQVANKQETDITNGGGFYPQVIEDALDRCTIQVQQIQEGLNRSMVMPLSSDLASFELSVGANADDRALKAIGFDVSGNPTLLGELDNGLLGTVLPEIGTYALLRAYTGTNTAYYVRGVASILDGGAGVFRVDASDTTSADNGGTILVDAIGRRWKREFTGVVNARWFGAKGDGVTNDSAKVSAALAAAEAVVCLAGGSGGFVLDASVTVPSGKALVSDYVFTDQRDARGFLSYKNRIILNSAASIQLSESSSVKGLVILRKGMVLPANAAEVALFAGTAIKTLASTSGQYVGHCAIVGFATGVATDAATNTEQLRCEYLNIDCKNGIAVEQVFDIAYIENCHCWPAASIGLPGVTDADLQRSGTAFLFKNGGDWNKWTNCFSFGYARAFVVDACNSVTALGCGADYTVTQTANPIGFSVTGNSGETRILGCQAAGQNVGYLIDTSSADGTVQLVGSNAWESDTHHVLVQTGKALIDSCAFRGGTANGVTVSSAGPVNILGTAFRTIGGIAINSTLAANIVRHSGCIFEGVTGARVVNPYSKTIASADPLVLDGENTFFNVAGTTNFGTLQNAADYAGKVVVLKFAAILTAFDGGASMKLAGNFVSAADSTLALASDGTTWFEVSRSIN